MMKTPAAAAALRAQAMDKAANPMFMAARGGRIVWVNAAFSQLYGYSGDEVLGKTPRLLKSGRQSADFYKDLWDTISAGTVWRGQLTNRKKSGELFDVEQTITPLCDEGGKVNHFLAVYEDITQRLRSEQHVTRLAMFDSVTGLPNRNQLLRRATEALARSQRNGKAAAVLLADLDHFKQVNDRLGHAAGDELLAQAARRMSACLRTADIVARLGGDEFAVLIEDLARPEQAVESAQRLLDAIAEPFEIMGHSVHVGVSIGIALSGSGMDSPEALLQSADLAMYQAKASGRGHYQFFDAGMDAAARRRYATESALRAALREDLLRIVFQPQVNLVSGEITGAEALLRWTDPQRGEVPASEFVALAEQTGLIFALNDWMLRHTIAEIAAWRGQLKRPVPVAINISAGHFDKVGLAATIESLLRTHQLPASALRIEITETVMLRPSITVHDNLRGLARMGVVLGVDDFGMGYSSLPSLREFPVDYIKLDTSYVGAIGRLQRDEQLLRAIIGIGRTLNLRLVAEGVETDAQAEFLIREHCVEAQGFLYSAGVPGAEFLRMQLAGSLTRTPLHGSSAPARLRLRY